MKEGSTHYQLPPPPPPPPPPENPPPPDPPEYEDVAPDELIVVVRLFIALLKLATLNVDNAAPVYQSGCVWVDS